MRALLLLVSSPILTLRADDSLSEKLDIIGKQLREFEESIKLSEVAKDSLR